MYIFVFASLTTASRVRFYIKNKLGISLEVNKVSGFDGIPGCSYGLFADKAHKDNVLEIINELNVNLIGVYDEKMLKGAKKDGVS